MQLVSRNIPYIGDPIINIYAFGDVHLGSSHHDKIRFAADIKTISEDRYSLAICLGDVCDAIVPSDSKRFRANEIDAEYLPHLATVAVYQRDRFIEQIEPIADKLIGVIEGNHEDTILHRHHVALTQDICRETGAEYLGNTALLRLTFTRMCASAHAMDSEGERMRSSVLPIYVTHGHSYGRKSGTPLNRLEDTASNFDASIYLAGHSHSLATSRNQRLSVPAKGTPKIVSRPQVFAVCGCYTTEYEEDVAGYSERAGHTPTDVGMVKIAYRPMSGDIRVEI